jgi:hypothetical protein
MSHSLLARYTLFGMYTRDWWGKILMIRGVEKASSYHGTTPDFDFYCLPLGDLYI